ncbi:MAG: hypothetical protein UHJ46_04580, partial [Treponema sp.]|nr:hypothetical protein [Treponema sp.]
FKKTRQLPAFLEGVKRIQKGLEMGYSIGLMCTEKNPLACHRFSLVARETEVTKKPPKKF